MKRFLSTLVLTVLLVASSWANASILDQKFEIFTPRGLSSGTAYTTLCDREGFIWFSTRNGIDRYDGRSFRHYRLNGNIERGLHDGMMIYLHQDADGRLWVYTERSIVYRYNPLTDTFEEVILFPQEDCVASLQDMYVNGDELLFAFTNGLMCYDCSNGGLKRIANMLTDRIVRSISPYVDGSLLISTNKGLVVYDPVQHLCTPIYERFFIDVRKAYFDAADRTIWVGSNGQGFYCIDEKDGGTITRLGDDPLIVYSICPYSDNEMLVGTDGNGVLLASRDADGFHIQQFAGDSSDAPFLIHSSCVRAVTIINGSIWFAMHFGGVTRLKPASAQIELRYPNPGSPSDSYVFGTDIDAQGRIWLAFNQSIGCFDAEGHLLDTFLDHEARFLTVKAAPDGTVWCGGFNTGLYHFDPVTRKTEYFSSVRGSSSKDCVYDVHVDSRGYVWVGGLDFGMTCIIPTQPRQIGDDPQKTLRFEHTSIRQVCDIDQLNDSTIVAATSDGLYLYNYYTQHQEHHFLVADAEQWRGTNFFSSSAVRHNREIWLATDGAGILCYDVVTHDFQSFGLSHGLPSLQLRGIELVNDSTLCVTSELDGVFSFDCNKHVFQQKLYHVDDVQFQDNSVVTDGKGNVIVGCDKCAVLIGPDDMVPHRTEASIHIDGHPIIDGTITLPADSPDLEVSFSTNDIEHQSEYHFFYRIKGIDDDFRHLDDYRHIEYHKIPAGNYELEVRAVGAGGQWCERTVHLVVERNYLTLLPYAILILCFIALIHLYLNLYRRKHRKRK